MRWLLLPVSLLAAAAAFFAQTAPPNPTGISAGHIHIVTADPAAYQKAIVSVLGGTPVNAGPLTMVKLPGIFFIMTQAKGAGPSGGSKGSVADHMGFSVKSFATLKAKAVAAGLNVQEVTPNVQAFVTLPNDVIIEVQEDTALPTETAFSHFHLGGDRSGMPRASGISKTFGATKASAARTEGCRDPERLRRLPGRGWQRGGKARVRMALPPAALPPPPAPRHHAGRFLDHIGFEVKDLDAFVKKLQADGIKLDSGPTDMTKQFGLKIAFLTDPVGTRIELTEGLSKQ